MQTIQCFCNIIIVLKKEELQSNKQIEKLAQLIVEKYKFNIEDASGLVNLVISEAFDEKYATYNYSDDARSLSID